MRTGFLELLLGLGFKNRIKGVGFIAHQLFPQGVVLPNKYGVYMLLNPYEAIEGTVLETGYFDEPVLNSLSQAVKGNDVFWDVGANVGLHCLTVKKLHPDVRCIAFEPFHLNFDRLQKNLALNPALSIEARAVALSDSVSTESLYTTIRNSGRTGLMPMENSQPTEVQITTVTGDLLVEQGLPYPTIMKLDTENHELAILKGCSKILESGRLKVIVYESFKDQEKIEMLLRSYNFEVSSIDNLDNFVATYHP